MTLTRFQIILFSHILPSQLPNISTIYPDVPCQVPFLLFPSPLSFFSLYLYTIMTHTQKKIKEKRYNATHREKPI